MDPEVGFHCFCQELLGRMIGRFPDIKVLLKAWRSQPDNLKKMFQQKEEEEESFLETMFLAWKECKEL